MNPRDAGLSVVLALGLLAAPVPSHGQQPGKVYRMGYLGLSTAGYDTDPQHCPIKGSPYWQAWVEGLRERGYTPGQNLVIECRWTEGRDERAPALAAELVSLKVDLLVTIGNPATRAAKQATSTIPIVMVLVLDPVGFGIVASLAHPGGNLTGLAEAAGVEIAGKRLRDEAITVMTQPGSRANTSYGPVKSNCVMPGKISIPMFIDFLPTPPLFADDPPHLRPPGRPHARSPRPQPPAGRGRHRCQGPRPAGPAL